MKTIISVLVPGVLLFANFGRADEPALTLIDQGKAKAVIVMAANPSPAAKLGATILSDHLFQISGARVNVIRENELPEGDDLIRICVGKSKLADALGASAAGLGPGGILIRTFPKGLVMLGADELTPSDPNGSRYAVTTFLEDALGVRFLWPGELGKAVPSRATIRVSQMNLRFTPWLVQRRIRMGGGWSARMVKGGERLEVTGEDFRRINTAAKQTRSTDAGWAGWHRLGGSLRLMSGHAFGHLWEKYGKAHPDWFAMAPNGSRDQSNSPHRARLCVSNPELIAAIAREKIETITRTRQRSVSIGPNDGGTTSFCTCPQCEALDAETDRRITLIDFSPGANRRPFEHVPLTDRYVHFWNEIARQVTAAHPDVWLTADAYSVYAAPPVKAKLHPNIAIRYVGVSYTNEEKRQRGLADWSAWARAARKIYFRSNLLLAGRRQGTPVVYVHKLAEDFAKLAPNRMIGTDLDSCMNHWATQGLNYYVMSKLLWKPDLDVDELIDDYCRSGFGDGANAVKRYFLKLEELTDRIAAEQLAVTDPYTPEAVAELRALLDAAAAATDSDPTANRRVAFLRAGLEYTDAYAEVFRINREWQRVGGRLAPTMKERFRVALDRNWAASRDIFDHHHLAVNVVAVAWGSWGYFGRFGWKGPSDETRNAAR